MYRLRSRYIKAGDHRPPLQKNNGGKGNEIEPQVAVSWHVRRLEGPRRRVSAARLHEGVQNSVSKGPRRTDQKRSWLIRPVHLACVLHRNGPCEARCSFLGAIEIRNL